MTHKSSGATFDVRAGETILDAALRQGQVFAYSCRTGSCAACKASLLAGTVDYDQRMLGAAGITAGELLLCQARPRTDLTIDAVEVAAAGDIEIRILPCRVTRIERLAHDVAGLHLRLPPGQHLPYLAGQYIDILLRDGRRRSFSLAGRPAPPQDLELHVRQVPGGRFSGVVFNAMRERDVLRFQGPFGTFFLRNDSDRPVILMAGGTGFAPIKAILEQALPAATGRSLHLFRGARARRDLYLDTLARRWAAEYSDFRYTPVLSEPQPGDAWHGARGRVHEAVVAAYPDLAGHVVYASGPPAMIEAGKLAFAAHGLDPAQLYYDSFAFAVEATAAG